MEAEKNYFSPRYENLRVFCFSPGYIYCVFSTPRVKFSISQLFYVYRLSLLTAKKRRERRLLPIYTKVSVWFMGIEDVFNCMNFNPQ